MTNYRRAQYGTYNPNAGYPANGDFDAWGGHLWPHGVPARLLGSTNYRSRSSGQTLIVTMRRELVPLWQLAFEIIDVKHHYPVFSYRQGEPWGPWGYENRAISGTDYASGHSAALSVDINAPYNPYARIFQSNMPPAMVADLESLGFFWGGRYEGQKYDAMHFGFCRRPASVPFFVARARQILGAAAPLPRPPKPKPPVEDKLKLDAEDQAFIKGAIDDAINKALCVSTEDEAADGNPNKYTLSDGVGRAIRLSSLTYTGQHGEPH